MNKDKEFFPFYHFCIDKDVSLSLFSIDTPILDLDSYHAFIVMKRELEHWAGLHLWPLYLYPSLYFPFHNRGLFDIKQRCDKDKASQSLAFTCIQTLTTGLSRFVICNFHNSYNYCKRKHRHKRKRFLGRGA